MGGHITIQNKETGLTVTLEAGNLQEDITITMPTGSGTMVLLEQLINDSMPQEISDVILGRITASDIPGLDASKLTSGVIDKDRLPSTIADLGITDAPTKTEMNTGDASTLTSAKTYTDNAITTLVGVAPSTLDTIGELAAQMAKDETAASALVITVGNKVDKVAGKGLSTEDYTTAEKNRLAALNNVDNTSDVNKPVSIPQQAAIDAVKKLVPQNLKSAAYTLALTDAGMSVDTTANITVPTNAAVAFPIGTVIGFTNMSTVSITLVGSAGVTLLLAGTTTTGNKTLKNYASGYLRKVAVDTWIVSGSGVA